MMSAVLSLCLCWTLSLCLLVSAAEVNITAEPGQSVSLPCRAPSSTDIIVVEWTRPGLEPEYVLMYRDGEPVTENQHPSFKDRVELENGKVKDGDVSMILKNVTRDDAGTYECRVVQRKTNHRKKRANLKNKPIGIINLEIQSGETEEGGDDEGGDDEGGDKEGGEKHHRVGLAVSLSAVLLLVAGVVGVFFYRKHKGPTQQSSVPPDEESQL